ncbi:MAG: hypothetical protein ACFCU7_10710 [Pleurocapsa sp.]
MLGEIESQLNQAKTNKQRLPLLRDRVLVGIMSLDSYFWSLIANLL